MFGFVKLLIRCSNLLVLELPTSFPRGQRGLQSSCLGQSFGGKGPSINFFSPSSFYFVTYFR